MLLGNKNEVRMNNVQVYNTLTKRVEKFKPLQDERVNFFVCGPTVYDFPHLGHAKTYTQFDFIVRYLRWQGYDVYYLQNITDIDDKIIRRAAERNISWENLAREFEAIYLEDMTALHNVSVNKYARATDHISAIVKQVNTLMDKGLGYRTSDGIYFEIAKFPEYGKLSGRNNLREEDAVSRVDDGRDKKGWNDFCLWKTSKPDEPYWDTELGSGRPGWHIEDTAITETYFGPQYDVHGGAVDLIFPHHEAEIAQMEAASGKKPLVKYWFHTGFLNVNSQKMSKSLGNFKTIREALDNYDYRVLRFFFISSHYRASIDYNGEVLEQAKNTVKRIDEFVFNIDPSYDDIEDKETIANFKGRVIKELNNDFNTPRAFAEIFDFFRIQNLKGKSGQRTLAFLRELNSFLDIMIFEDKQGQPDDEIRLLIEKREYYRKNKDFEMADAVRIQLLVKGIQVYDTKNGIRWKKITVQKSASDSDSLMDFQI
jgi:cysteinyl-tRNA synthetase